MESSSPSFGDNAKTYQHVFVMRHGDRIDEFEPLWTSKASRPWDPPLTEDGLIRAFRTGHKIRSQFNAFSFDRVFVSPFVRCVQTASEAVSALSAALHDPSAMTSKDVASIDEHTLKVSVEFGLCEVLNEYFIKRELVPRDGNFSFNMLELQTMLPSRMVDLNAEKIYRWLPEWQEPFKSGESRYVNVVKALADKYPLENILIVTHGNGVGSLFSNTCKDAIVYAVEYCGYVGLRRAFSQKGNVVSAGEFELLVTNGIEYIPSGSEDDAPDAGQTRSLLPTQEPRQPINEEPATEVFLRTVDEAQNRSASDDGEFPQQATSLPTLSEAVSYLAHATSYITGCFSDYSVYKSDEDCRERDLVANTSVGTQEHWGVSRVSQERHSGSFETSTSVSYSNMHDEVVRASQSSTALVESNDPYSSGVSIFQGLIERARRTVRGSADDIGWLQKDPEMPPVEDGTDRFSEILNDIGHGIHRLPDSVVYLLVPGLFSNHGPLYFVSTKAKFSKMGLTCHIAKIHSEASVDKNAREIKEYIEEIYWGSGKRVLLLGHSKGGVDAAAALSLYWSDLRDKVAGLALAQSPYGGSPIATDILRQGQLGDYVNLRKLLEILICKVIKGDIQALEDLTYERRKEFLKKHSLPRELPVVSLRTEASISPAVLATLSQVAHAELPLGQAAKLPVVMPLGAAMAACAQLLQVRYGQKSDGLVTCCDAEVPGSVVVRPTHKLDHAWMVYSPLNNVPTLADAANVCEALLTLLVEVGHRKRHELAMKDD